MWVTSSGRVITHVVWWSGRVITPVVWWSGRAITPVVWWCYLSLLCMGQIQPSTYLSSLIEKYLENLTGREG